MSIVNIKYRAHNETLRKMNKEVTVLQGHTLAQMRKQTLEDMINAFTSGRDFICKVGETLPGLNSAVCKVRRMVYRYTLNTDAGEELVTKDIEDDADVAAIVLGRCVVYVDVSVDPSSPAVAAEMKVKAARTDPALHDRVFDQRGSYTAHQMAEELQSDLRRRLTIPGCAPPVSLYGIVVKPAMIKCVCPRETVIDYKDPTDSHQYLLHAVKCPVLRKVVPSQLQKAFTATVDAEKKHNLHKNESQKERARERADKAAGVRQDAILRILGREAPAPAPVPACNRRQRLYLINVRPAGKKPVGSQR